ncbi:MAG TPA: hypothetical protein VK066_06380 [Chloroflexota bacterium]|nr:hypothetical protein [Chloroflexota bacterium]
MADRLEALARRVQSDPAFLAAALADYAHSEGLDERGLAAALGCLPGQLSRLRLCRRPRDEPTGQLRRDVEQIAARFGVRADVLAEAVRRSNALAALRRAGEPERGTLMAARDREDDVAPADNPSGEP